MNKLRVLIVEDTPSMSDMLLKRLDDITKFKVELRSEADGAVRLAKSEHFDVLFIDLDLRDSPKDQPFFEGIGVCEEVRKSLKEAVIVMYSGWINRGEEGSFQDYYRCVEAGADEILSRTELFVLPAKELTEKIEKWVKDKKVALKAKSEASVVFDTDIRTSAAKETYRAETLEAIVLQCAPEMKHFEVKALQAGYSGSAILRVSAKDKSDSLGDLRLILKVGRSQFALEDELRRRPKPGSRYEAHSAFPNAQAIINHDGVYAIYIREVREKILLRAFLTQPAAKGDRSMLSKVVTDLLVAPAQEAKPWEDFDLQDDAYQFKASASSEVSDFLNDAGTWKHALQRADLDAIKTVKQFVDTVIQGRWGFTMAKRHAAQLHGDFHCRNVFVTHGEAPVLIDFGRSTVYPRLFDFAALDTDLIISVMDSGNGVDHDFKKVNLWLRRATALFPFDKAPQSKQAPGKIHLLRHILVSQMTTKLKSVSPSEYGEALLFQLLRYLRFENITPAKKILATHIMALLAKRVGIL